MAKKRCDVCGERPANPETPEGQLCIPCYYKAGWENTHSDYDHDGIAAGEVKWGQTTHRTKKEFNEWLADEKRMMQDCWVCHPELDESAKPVRSSAGTSRAGMVMNVKRGQSPKDKADTVMKLLGGFTVSVRTAKGQTVLKAQNKESSSALDVLVLVWDSHGRYDYAASHATVGGKKSKVRNVAEAIRVASTTR